jgi:hypothetical protein
MGLGAWAGGATGEGEARLMPRPRGRISNRVGDRSVLRRQTATRSNANHFLICEICEICG